MRSPLISCAVMATLSALAALSSSAIAQGRYSLASPLVKPGNSAAAPGQPLAAPARTPKSTPSVTPVLSNSSEAEPMPSPKLADRPRSSSLGSDVDLSAAYADLSALQLVVIYKDQALMRPAKVELQQQGSGSPAAAAAAQVSTRRAPLLLRNNQVFTLGSQAVVPVIEGDQVRFFVRGRMSAPFYTAVIESSGGSGYGLTAVARDKDEVVSTGVDPKSSLKKSGSEPAEAAPPLGLTR